MHTLPPFNFAALILKPYQEVHKDLPLLLKKHEEVFIHPYFGFFALGSELCSPKGRVYLLHSLEALVGNKEMPFDERWLAAACVFCTPLGDRANADVKLEILLKALGSPGEGPGVLVGLATFKALEELEWMKTHLGGALVLGAEKLIHLGRQKLGYIYSQAERPLKIEHDYNLGDSSNEPNLSPLDIYEEEHQPVDESIMVSTGELGAIDLEKLIGQASAWALMPESPDEARAEEEGMVEAELEQELGLQIESANLAADLLVKAYLERLQDKQEKNSL